MISAEIKNYPNSKIYVLDIAVVSDSTEEEQSFDINVKNNFPDVFEHYLQNNRTIQCYYCDFRSKSKSLSNSKDEMNKHLNIEHKKVINTFEAEELVIENLWHAEFLELFATD